MGILGKLLIFANLLAAGGFVYLAVQDWNKRQLLTASMLRHRLLLQGLPFDGPDIPAEEDPEIPFVVETSGGQSTETVSKRFLEIYFQENKGTSKLGAAEVVANQVGELKRARQKVQQLIDAADGGPAKATIAATMLALQAETLDERANIARLKADGNDGELKALLLAKFDEVIDKAKTRDETERRMKATHLLFCLDTEPVWQKRVAMIVGLRRYGPSIAAQTTRFDLMFTQVQRQIEQDQRAYTAALDTLWEQATARTLEVIDSQKRKAAFEAQLAKDTEFRNRIKTQVEQLTVQYDKVRAQVDVLLVQQAASEQVLFDLQRTVGRLLADMFRMEEELARRERERKS